jgi:hypothetical protein
MSQNNLLKEEQAINVATYLENIITCEADGLRNAVATLKDMIEGFSILGLEDIALLLATLMSRTLACYQDRSLPMFSNHAVELSRIILALRDKTTAHLFEAVIVNLDGLEVPMCLALWSESIRNLDDDVDRSLAIRDLFTGLRSHYVSSISHPAVTPKTVVAGMVVKWLCLYRMDFPLFGVSLHFFVERALGCSEWEAIWKMLNEQHVYDLHRETIKKNNENLIAIWQLQENGVL